MPEVTQATVVMDVDPKAVISVIADFPAYPEWAREVQRVEVLSHEGDGWADRVRFELDAGLIKDTYVLDYAWEIAAAGTGLVSWDMVESVALRKLSGFYQIEHDDRGASVTYGLTVTPEVPMVGTLRRKAEQMIIDTALSALTTRAEHWQALHESGERA